MQPLRGAQIATLDPKNDAIFSTSVLLLEASSKLLVDRWAETITSKNGAASAQVMLSA